MVQQSMSEMEVNAEDFEAFILDLKKKITALILIDICAVDFLLYQTQIKTNRFHIVYHFLDMQNNQRFRIKVPCDENGFSLMSLAHLWKGAKWFEEEINDLFGLIFIEPNNSKWQSKNKLMPQRLLTSKNMDGHPLRKDFIKRPLSSDLNSLFDNHFGEDTVKNVQSWIDFDPSHPVLNGNISLHCRMEGEFIRQAKVSIGYQHRCFEKISEGKEYNLILPLADRLNFQSGPMCSIGMCMAVEEMINIEIPPRAKAIRMIWLELGRIGSHFLSIALMSKCIGVELSYNECLVQREKVAKLFELISGSRMTISSSILGGVEKDLTNSWITLCMKFIRSIEKSLASFHRLLTNSFLWKERTQIGDFSGYEAIHWGITGPCLRATGINYDLRKASPYYFYKEVDFAIPLGQSGNAFDRYLVRVEEINESCKIILQLVQNLPHGIFKNEEEEMKVVNPPAGDWYSATEGANGEMGYYLVSDGGERPYRLKVRPPSFPLAQAIPELIKGKQLSDAFAIYSSLNIVASEMDR